MNVNAFEELSEAELDGLIERVEHAIQSDLSVSTHDLHLLLKALMMLVQLQNELIQRKTTVHKLRKLAGIVQSSEKLRAVTGVSATPKNQDNTKPGTEKKRKERVAPVIHRVETQPLEDLAKGDTCPECERGKLYKYDPAVVLRISGQTPLTSTQYILERLRCNACGAYFTAALPETVLRDGEAQQKYGYSARAIMAIHKHFAGLPFYRQQTLQQMFGVPVSASTLFDQNECLANDLQPVFNALKQQSADALHYHLDDTSHRILNQSHTQKPDRKTGELKKRTGIYASGVIATLADDHRIILFQTNIGHAGEWLDDILTPRHPDSPAPILMSDALSRNQPTQLKPEQYHLTLCNSHARREFVDLYPQFPDKIPWVLEQYSLIWQHDEHCKAHHYSPPARLAYHRQHSLPVMETLKSWGEEQLASGEVEANSGLGGAIKYFLRHYTGLTGFCRIEGAQLDNNLMEATLKLVIRGRKNALFYKTLAGAAIADVILSVIATCYQADVNPFDYLVELQRHANAVKANPLQWLPWNYHQASELQQLAA